ncbi:MAG: SRPBCC domain-containing protein [Chloroflexi bacterium]|nr:SRPBCC domain-containing protein [Chloroflexota bacterium]
MQSFEVSEVIPATPQKIYEAWLDGEKHGLMTGGGATGKPLVGGKFTAWDGYITGENLELEPNRHIVQAWRTSEFSSEHPHSRLEVLLQEVKAGTRVTLRHSEIPDGRGESYKQGWTEHYFDPMKRYFSK